jgi:hypothetical protein
MELWKDFKGLIKTLGFHPVENSANIYQERYTAKYFTSRKLCGFTYKNDFAVRRFL